MTAIFQALGYPLRSYISKNNLEPIEHEQIDEEQTFFPFVPPNVNNPTAVRDDILDINWQLEFLEKNTMESLHFKSILDYHKLYRSGKECPEKVVQKIKCKIEDSEAHSPPMRCFTQLNWELAQKVIPQEYHHDYFISYIL